MPWYIYVYTLSSIKQQTLGFVVQKHLRDVQCTNGNNDKNINNNNINNRNNDICIYIYTYGPDVTQEGDTHDMADLILEVSYFEIDPCLEIMIGVTEGKASFWTITSQLSKISLHTGLW